MTPEYNLTLCIKIEDAARNVRRLVDYETADVLATQLTIIRCAAEELYEHFHKLKELET